MTNKIRLGILLLSLGLLSCDRIGHYKFEVTNSIDRPIEVEFTSISYDTAGTVVIQPNETIEVFRSGTGLLGKNEKPHDIFEDNDTLDFTTFSVSLDKKVIEKDFRIRKRWTYKAIDREFGLYSLSIDSTSLKK